MLALLHGQPQDGSFLGAHDGDSFIRLHQAERLAGGEIDLYNQTLPRSNTPHGESYPWTLPIHGVIAGMAMLSTSTAEQSAAAVKDAAMLWHPLLYALGMLGMLWLLVPLMQHWQRVWFFVLAGAMLNPFFHIMFEPGAVDHHSALWVLAVWLLGASVRVLQGKSGYFMVLTMALLSALGLWISPEFALPIAVFALALLWRAVQGDNSIPSRMAVWSGVVTALCAFFLLLEYPAGERFTLVYDNLSLVHVVLATGGVWAAGVLWLVQRRSELTSRRFVLLGAGMLPWLAIVYAAVPGAFAGPAYATDARLDWAWYPYIKQFSSVFDSPNLLLIWAVFLCFTLGFGWQLWRQPKAALPAQALWGLWLLAVVVLAATAVQMRWIDYLHVFNFALFVLLADRAWGKLQQLAPTQRLPRQWVLAGLLILGMYGVNYAAAKTLPAPTPEQETAHTCRQNLYAELENGFYPTVFEAHTPARILTVYHAAARILYHTPHEVVAWSSHRNPQGIVDVYHTFFAENSTPQKVLEMVQRRGITHVVYCQTDRVLPENHWLRHPDVLPPWLKVVENTALNPEQPLVLMMGQYNH